MRSEKRVFIGARETRYFCYYDTGILMETWPLAYLVSLRYVARPIVFWKLYNVHGFVLNILTSTATARIARARRKLGLTSTALRDAG